MPDADRLRRQIEFLVEIDRLKGVSRRTCRIDESRRENAAEHSWHLAVTAILLLEYAAEPSLDLLRVVKMLLVHDLVEIDAGDTFVYDEAGNSDKADREQKAAERIFGLLPPDQADAFRSLWDEFEARATPESRFACALDRLQPILHNYRTRGTVWREHGVTPEQVIAHNQHMADGSPQLWQYARQLIREAIEKGYFEQ